MEVKKEVKTKKAPIPKFIDINDILQITNKGVFIGTRRLDKSEIQALKADADHFAKSFLWQMMHRDVHYICYLQATNKARSQDDINYANAMYQNLELLDKFIKNCRTL